MKSGERVVTCAINRNGCKNAENGRADAGCFKRGMNESMDFASPSFGSLCLGVPWRLALP